MMHVYFNSLYFAYFSTGFQYVGIKRIEICYFFVALFVFSLCPFDISVGVGAFVIGLSQISSVFSTKK